MYTVHYKSIISNVLRCINQSSCPIHQVPTNLIKRNEIKTISVALTNITHVNSETSLFSTCSDLMSVHCPLFLNTSLANTNTNNTSILYRDIYILSIQIHKHHFHTNNMLKHNAHTQNIKKEKRKKKIIMQNENQ